MADPLRRTPGAAPPDSSRFIREFTAGEGRPPTQAEIDNIHAPAVAPASQPEDSAQSLNYADARDSVRFNLGLSDGPSMDTGDGTDPEAYSMARDAVRMTLGLSSPQAGPPEDAPPQLGTLVPPGSPSPGGAGFAPADPSRSFQDPSAPMAGSVAPPPMPEPPVDPMQAQLKQGLVDMPLQPPAGLPELQPGGTAETPIMRSAFPEEVIPEDDRLNKGIYDFALNVSRGTMDLPVNASKTVGILASALDKMTAAEGAARLPEDYVSYRAGRYIEKWADRVFAGRPEKEKKTWLDQVANGLGQSVGFMAGNLASGTRYLGAAVLGAVTNAPGAYEDALAHGASHEDGIKAFLMAGGLGVTEAAPLGDLLRRMDKGTGGAMKQLLLNTVTETVEEFLQEYAQTVGENAIANYFVGYDPDRELLENAWHAGTAGGASGAILSFTMTLFGIRMRGGDGFLHDPELGQQILDAEQFEEEAITEVQGALDESEDGDAELKATLENVDAMFGAQTFAGPERRTEDRERRTETGGRMLEGTEERREGGGRRLEDAMQLLLDAVEGRVDANAEQVQELKDLYGPNAAPIEEGPGPEDNQDLTTPNLEDQTTEHKTTIEAAQENLAHALERHGVAAEDIPGLMEEVRYEAEAAGLDLNSAAYAELLNDPAFFKGIVDKLDGTPEGTPEGTIEDTQSEEIAAGEPIETAPQTTEQQEEDGLADDIAGILGGLTAADLGETPTGEPGTTPAADVSPETPVSSPESVAVPEAPVAGDRETTATTATEKPSGGLIEKHLGKEEAEAHAADKEKLKELFGQFMKDKGSTAGAGVPIPTDPEFYKILSRMSLRHLRAGAMEFAAFTKAMTAELGQMWTIIPEKAQRRIYDVSEKRAMTHRGGSSETQATETAPPTPAGGVTETKGKPERGGSRGGPGPGTGQEAAPQPGAPEGGRAGTRAGGARGEGGGRVPAPVSETPRPGAGSAPGAAESEVAEKGKAGVREKPEPAAPDTDPELKKDFNLRDLPPPQARTPTTRKRLNERAMEVLRRLDKDPASLTQEDRETLRGYTGKGGIKQENLGSAEAVGNLFEHYTSYQVSRFLWDVMEQMGFKPAGKRVLEPAVGVGNIMGQKPAGVLMTGVDIDPVASKIASILYPQQKIRIGLPFERFAGKKGSFDAVVTNVPFFEDRGPLKHHPDAKEYVKIQTLHDFMLQKSLDQLKPGGVLVAISSTGTMDKPGQEARTLMNQKAAFIGAFRLWSGAFGDNANTQVATDIIVMQKRSAPLPAPVGDKWVWAEEEFGDPDGKGKGYQKSFVASVPVNELGGSRISSYWLTAPRDHLIAGSPKNHPGNLDVMELGYKTQFLGKVGILAPVDILDAFRRARATKMKFWPIKAAAGVSQDVEVGPDGPVIAADQLGGAKWQDSKPLPRADFPIGAFHTYDGVSLWMSSPVLNPKQDVIEPRMVKYTGLPKQQKRRVLEALPALESLAKVLKTMLAEGDPTAEQLKLRTAIDSYKTRFGKWYAEDMSLTRAFLRIHDPRIYHLRALVDPLTGKFSDIAYKKSVMTKAVFSFEKPKSGKLEDVADWSFMAHKGLLNLEEMAKHWEPAGSVGSTKEGQEALEGFGDKPTRAQKKQARLIDRLSTSSEYFTEHGLWYRKREYLSGKLWDKIDEAERAGLLEQADALRGALPEQANLERLTVSVGAGFVSNDMRNEFLQDVGFPGLKLIAQKWEWLNQGAAEAAKRSKETLRLKNAGNVTIGRAVQMKMNNEGVRTKKMSRDARQRMTRKVYKEVNREFTDWIRRDSSRRETFEDFYNRAFRSFVSKVYDGLSLDLSGTSQTLDFHKWQLEVTEMLLEMGVGINAHDVGGGKTIAMALLGGLLQKYGKSKKTLFVVPLKIINKWAKEILMVWPNARIINMGNLTVKTRLQMLAKAAFTVPDPNAPVFILTTVQGFEKMPLSPKKHSGYIEARIQELLMDLDPEASLARDLEEGGGGSKQSRGARNILKQIQKLREKLEKLKNMKKDNVLWFEEMGIDSVISDESHVYKNFGTTSLGRALGLSQQESNRAADFNFKARYIREIADNRNVYFATATPTPNSPLEIYNMLLHLAPSIFSDRNIHGLDGFISTFGRTESSFMMDEGGNFKEKTKLVGYQNLQDLLKLFYQYVDKRTSEELGVKRPDMDTEYVYIDASKEQQKMFGELRERAITVRSGNVETGPDGKPLDSILQVVSDARKAAISLWLLHRGGDDLSAHPKIVAVVDLVVKNYVTEKQGAKHKPTPEQEMDLDWPVQANGDPVPYWKNTQLIFLDIMGLKLSTNLQQRIRELLVEKGIPEHEIQLINSKENSKAADRERVTEEFNSGEVRVLIGSTSAMGEGMDLQVLTTHAYHLDVPWNPGGLIQRDGRYQRQGNKNEQVKGYRLVTKGSFDAYAYQLLNSKQKWISELESTTADDIDNEGGDIDMGFEEIMGALTPAQTDRMYFDGMFKFRRALEHEAEAVQDRESLADILVNTNREIDDRVARRSALRKAQHTNVGEAQVAVERLQSRRDDAGHDFEAARDVWGERSKEEIRGYANALGVSPGEVAKDEVLKYVQGKMDGLDEQLTKARIELSRQEDRMETRADIRKNEELLARARTRKENIEKDRAEVERILSRFQDEYNSIGIQIHKALGIMKLVNDSDFDESLLTEVAMDPKTPQPPMWDKGSIELVHQTGAKQNKLDLSSMIFPVEHANDPWVQQLRVAYDQRLAETKSALEEKAAEIDKEDDDGSDGPPGGQGDSPMKSRYIVPGNKSLTVKDAGKRSQAATRTQPQAGALKSRQEMIEELARKLGIPMRGKRGARGVRRRGTLGLFRAREESIFQKTPGDMPTLYHEIGHYLEKYLFGTRAYPRYEAGRFLEMARKYRDELVPIATTPGAGKKGLSAVLPEGFAEFVRMWVMEPSQAADKAPRFNALFTRYLRKKDRDLYDLLMAHRKEHALWRSAGHRARVRASWRPYKTESKWRSVFNWGQIYRYLFEDLNDVRLFMKDAAKRGFSVEADQDPYILMRLYRGWVAKVEHFLKYGTFSLTTLRVNGEGLQAILRPINNRLDDFKDYLIAKRAVELHGRNIETGIDAEDAEKTVLELQDEFDDYAERIHAYSRRTLRLLRDSGIISHEKYAAWIELNQSYVPFYRMFDEFSDTANPQLTGQSGVGGEKYGNLGQPVKRIRGSFQTIYDPLQSLTKNTYAFMSLAVRNEAMVKLVKLAEESEGLGLYVERYEKEVRPIHLQLEEIKRSLVNAGLPHELMEQVMDLSDWATIFRPVEYAPKGTAFVWINGERRLYRLEKGLYNSVLAMEKELLTVMTKVVGAAARSLRMGATLFNPAFYVVRNPARDTFSAFVNSQYGFVPILDTVRGFSHAISVFRKEGPTDLYKMAMRGGGFHATMVSMDLQSMRENLHILTGRPGDPIWRSIVRHPIVAMKLFGDFSEQSTRLGEMRKAIIKEGPSKRGIIKGSMAMREVSLDFLRRGAGLRALSHMTAFYRSQMQGWDKLVRNVNEQPGTTFAKYGTLTAISVLLYALNRDDDEYERLAVWDKMLFWHIPVPKAAREKYGFDFLRFPKPFLPGIVFASMPERLMEFWDGTRTGRETLDDMSWTLIKEIPLPIPTAAQVLAENYFNYSLHRGYSLYPQHLDQNAEPWLRYRPGRVSMAAKWLGKMADVSPAKIDNLISGVSGGVGTTLIRIPDAYRDLTHTEMARQLSIEPIGPTPPALTPADVPVVGQFFSRRGTSSDYYTDRFYRGMTEMRQAVGSINVMKSRGMWADLPKYLSARAAEVAAAPSFEVLSDWMTELRGLRDIVESTSGVDADLKRHNLNQLNRAITALARSGYEGMQRLGEEADRVKNRVPVAQ